MSSKYRHECIITNCTDFFCLICESYILSEDDAAKHIEKPIHKKILAVTRYLENHEDDRIRKVPKGYYCEYCSIFICTSPKVKLHVAEISHANKKGMCRLQRLNNGLIYNDLLISENSWHSLKDNSCSVCDTNFYHRDIHKSDPTHILNLMQKKVEFGPQNFIYRVIDDNTFQCLPCNTISTLKCIDLHVKDSLHKESLEKCNKLYHSSLNNNEIYINSISKSHENDTLDSTVTKIDTEKNENPSTARDNKPILQDSDSNESCSSDEYFKIPHKSDNIKMTREDNKERILDSVIYFAKNEININFETEMGFCKKCFKNIPFDFGVINEHIEKDKQSNRQRKVSDYVPYACDVNMTRVDMANEDLKADSVKSINSSSCSSDDVIDINETVSQIDDEKLVNKCFGEEKNTMKSDKDSNNSGANATSSDQKTNKYLDKEKVVTKSDSSSNNAGASATAKDIDDPRAYAQENRLTYNEKNNNAYCRICEVRIPASSLKCMKEHVNGVKHKKSILRNKTEEKPLTMAFRRFREQITMKVERFMFFVVRIEYVFINKKYCLSGESYNLIVKRGMRMRCILCEETVDKADVADHSESDDHEEALLAVPVVISLRDEFVREIGRGLYHCGFCNLILSNWKELQQHLQCGEHDEAKSKAKMILMLHLPEFNRAGNRYF